MGRKTFDGIEHEYFSTTTSAVATGPASDKPVISKAYASAYRNKIANLEGTAATVYLETLAPRDGVNFPVAVVEANTTNPATCKVCRLTDTLFVGMEHVADLDLEVFLITVTGNTPSISTAVSVNAADTDSANIISIGTAGTHFACVYRDNGGDDYPCVRIGSVATGAIVMGTEKEMTATAGTENAGEPYGICEPRAGVLAIAWADDADDLAVIAATYSGTTVATPGTLVEFDAAAPNAISCCKMEEGYIFVTWSDAGASHNARVASVSAAAAIGTPGTEKVVVAAAHTSIDAKFSEQNKVVIGYVDANSDAAVIACTTAAAGTTITAGTGVVIEAGTMTDLGIDMIDNTQGMLKYDNGTSGRVSRFSVAAGSTTTVTADAKIDNFVETAAAGGGAGGIACTPTGKCVIVYEDADNDVGVKVGQYYENRIIDIRSATASIVATFDVMPVYQLEATN